MAYADSEVVGFHVRPRNLTGQATGKDVRDYQILHGEELSALTYYLIWGTVGAGGMGAFLKFLQFKGNDSVSSLANLVLGVTALAGIASGFGYYNRARINPDGSKAIDPSKPVEENIQPLLNELNDLSKDTDPTKQEEKLQRRRNAADKLSLTNHVDAPKPLLARFLDKEDDSQVRANSALSLGLLGIFGKEAIAGLQTGLEDSDSTVGTACAYALGFLSIGGRQPEGLEPLIKFFNKPEQTAVGRGASIWAICSYNNERARDQALKCIDDHDKQVREIAIAHLCNRLDKTYDETIMNAVVQRFKSGDETESIILTNIVNSLKHVRDEKKRKELVPELLLLLENAPKDRSEDVALSKTIISTLAEYKSPEAVRSILELLCTNPGTNPELVNHARQAMLVLLDQGKDEIDNALLACLKDKNADVRTLAAVCTVPLGEKAVQPLIECLNDKNDKNVEVKRAAISALGTICAHPAMQGSGTVKTVNEILKELETSDSDVKREAKKVRESLERLLTPGTGSPPPAPPAAPPGSSPPTVPPITNPAATPPADPLASSEPNTLEVDYRQPKTPEDFITLLNDPELKAKADGDNYRSDIARELVGVYYQSATSPNKEIFNTLQGCLAKGGHVANGVLEGLRDIRENVYKLDDLNKFLKLLDNPKTNCSEVNAELLRDAKKNLEKVLKEQVKKTLASELEKLKNPETQVNAVEILIKICEDDKLKSSDLYSSQQTRAIAYGALVDFAGRSKSGGYNGIPVIEHDTNARIIASGALAILTPPEDTTHFQKGSFLAPIIHPDDNPQIRKNMMDAVLIRQSDPNTVNYLLLCGLGRFNDTPEIKMHALDTFSKYVKSGKIDGYKVTYEGGSITQCYTHLHQILGKMDKKSLIDMAVDPQEHSGVRRQTILLLSTIYKKSQERLNIEIKALEKTEKSSDTAEIKYQENSIRNERKNQESILQTLKDCLYEPVKQNPDGFKNLEVQLAAGNRLIELGTNEAKAVRDYVSDKKSNPELVQILATKLPKEAAH